MPSVTRSSRRDIKHKPGSAAADTPEQVTKVDGKRRSAASQSSPAKKPKISSSNGQSSSDLNHSLNAGGLKATDLTSGEKQAEHICSAKADSEKKEKAISTKPADQKGQKTKEDSSTEMASLACRTSGLRMFVGAHVSAAKGIQNAVTNSKHIGGNAFALFLKSQRKWDNPPLQGEHRDLFKKACTEHEYDASKYILPHGSYLVNLAQEDPEKAQVAYNSFLDDLRRCEALGIRLYNFHPGATNKTSLESSLSRLAKMLMAALDATETVIPVLETMCGHGTTIGGPLSHFRDLFALIPESYHSRLGICVDTCHSFAAGYDLRSPAGWEKFMTEFDETIGLKFLRAWHLNDSKTPLGSKRDLHANIGTGFLGLRAFHNLMNDKRVEGMPMILETPIDRPIDDEKDEAIDGEKDGDGKKAGKTKRKTMTSKSQSKKTVEDKSIWAREIKLLESLTGMDPASKEFLDLEARLANEGKDERIKHQALFEKKEKEKAGKNKDLRSMFAKGKGAAKKGKANSDGEDDDDECGSGHE